MKPKADKFPRKTDKKPKTEDEKEEDLVELIIRMIVDATLKEFYEKNKKR